jgi:8-oxo-dGTP pyrophosphatase MutT (NUDIX family)
MILSIMTTLARDHPAKSVQMSYASSDFVESAGAIPFDLSKRQIYLVHYGAKNEWLLAKGRRNLREARADAGLREVQEETGLKCSHLAVQLSTRAPAASDPADVGDVARVHGVEREPFMFTMRELGSGKGVKLIWWYIAQVAEDAPVGNGESAFKVTRFGYQEAIEKLTHEADRKVLRQAVDIVEQTFPSADTK